MKYWEVKRVESGFGRFGISLKGDNESRIVSLSKPDNGNNKDIVFMEECDGYFKHTMKKEFAINALKEAIKWIEGLK